MSEDHNKPVTKPAPEGDHRWFYAGAGRYIRRSSIIAIQPDPKDSAKTILTDISGDYVFVDGNSDDVFRDVFKESLKALQSSDLLDAESDI